MSASFAKLRDGSWGVRVQGDPPPAGATITVVKRDGTATTVVVDRIIWKGQGVALASIVPDRPPPPRRYRGGYYHCRQCGDPEDICDCHG